jgi:hypothetical protein
VAAALALRAALREAPALASVPAPSGRQSGAFMWRVKGLPGALRRPVNVAGRVLPCYEKQAAEADGDGLYFRPPGKTRESTPQLHPGSCSRVVGLRPRKARCASTRRWRRR